MLPISARDVKLSIRTKCFLFSSVADPGCLSRIPDPDFCPSRIRIRIPDLGFKTATNKRSEQKFVVSPFFLPQKSPKLNYIKFELVKKKLGPKYKEL
jgi:hypothetical protein